MNKDAEVAKKTKLFGDRVLFTPIEEELTGSIVLPEKANRSYELGRVLHVGDGIVRNRYTNVSETRTPLVEVGDCIWFQIDRMMAANNTIRIDGKTYMHTLQADLLARIKRDKDKKVKVTLESFEILGKWCLMKTFEDKVPGSSILLPDTASDNVRMLRYEVVQRGATVKDEVQIGTEVLIEKRAAQLVAINNEPYFYINSDHIVGVYGNQ
jgi:co-chaperonin GroES (HSP10)